MMKKLMVEEPILPSHATRLRMFQELCVFPRVDTSVFSLIARRNKLCIASFGDASCPSRIEADGAALFDALEPLYSTALSSFGTKLTELDEMGLGRGLQLKWNICGVGPAPYTSDSVPQIADPGARGCGRVSAGLTEGEATARSGVDLLQRRH